LHYPYFLEVVDKRIDNLEATVAEHGNPNYYCLVAITKVYLQIE
jgi:hypothetical protein